MPRISERQRYIQNLLDTLEELHRQLLNRHRNMIVDIYEDRIYDMYANELRNVQEQRYLFREEYRERPYDEFSLILNRNENDAAWVNDLEFLGQYRMEREKFDALVLLIEDNDIFQTYTNKPQAPPAHQLLVLLKYLGNAGSGSNNPSLRSHFKIGRGTVQLYRERAMKAVLQLRDAMIKWPNAIERTAIAERIKEKYGMPGCVGIVDGTLFPLTFQPSRVDAPEYSGRKHLYSLTTLIACDDQRRIRYFFAGCPGSTHDNRVFKMCRLYRQADLMFSDRQYTLADSAYENTNHMVSAYRRYRGNVLTYRQTHFNAVMSRLRIISEHTIGMLKGRFPWLKSIPALLSEDEETIRSTIQYVECCIILHNFLGASLDDFPDDWLQAGMDERVDIADNDPDLEEQGNVQPRDQLRLDVTNYVAFQNEIE
jgi:DDE superfamily endonuclease